MHSAPIKLLAAIAILACQYACAPHNPAPADLAAASTPGPTLELPVLGANTPANYPGLHNVVAFAPQVYSGSVPEGHAGFQTLRSLGFRTIVSVDGQLPDVESAEGLGLQYVHLPVGYNGFNQQRRLELARVLRDLPRPIYVHCHHGKHRSAAAAGAALVTLGESSNAQALAHMKVSGTSPAYVGLFACVRDAQPAPSVLIDAAPNDFPSRWQTTDMVQRMVEIDDAFDRLKAIQAAGWKTPSDHPDLVPIAEAGRLADLFRTTPHVDEANPYPAGFLSELDLATNAAQRLEDVLAHNPSTNALLDAQMKSLGASCLSCHRAFRDERSFPW